MIGSGLTHLSHCRTSPQRSILYVAQSGTAISRLSGLVRLSYVIPHHTFMWTQAVRVQRLNKIRGADTTRSTEAFLIDQCSVTIPCYLCTECDNPTIDPTEVCVPEGYQYTCEATSGTPGDPTYTVHYQSEGGSWLASAGQSYHVQGSGNFSLVCEVKYTHPICPEYAASCYGNLSGIVAPGTYVETRV